MDFCQTVHYVPERSWPLPVCLLVIHLRLWCNPRITNSKALPKATPSAASKALLMKIPVTGRFAMINVNFVTLNFTNNYIDNNPLLVRIQQQISIINIL